MANAVPGLHDTLSGLQQAVEGAERHRDEHSVDVLRKYWQCHIDSLLPLTQTVSEGIFDQIIHYLGAGDEASKSSLRQNYQALWELLLHEYRAGVLGLLLAWGASAMAKSARY